MWSGCKNCITTSITEKKKVFHPEAILFFERVGTPEALGGGAALQKRGIAQEGENFF